MSETDSSFVDSCLRGVAYLEDVDDWVDGWHDSHAGREEHPGLDEYLGFLEGEGALWAERPEALRFIVAARRLNRPILDVLWSRDSQAIAARAGAPHEANAVVAWLRQTGRLPAADRTQ